MSADLTQRLRAAAVGREEWRVQDPKDGAYCIAFSRNDGYSLDPEREARQWLADHQARFPTSGKSGYVVACVTVQTQNQRLMSEAADALALKSDDGGGPNAALLDRLRSTAHWQLTEGNGDDATHQALQEAIAEIERLRIERQDLVLLVGRLIRRMRAARTGQGMAAGDDALEQQVIGYLKRKGMTSPLRDEGSAAAEQTPTPKAVP